MKRLMIVGALLMALVLVVGSAGAAQAAQHGRIVGADEVVREDLVVVGDDLTIEENGTVIGDVTVFGGVARVGGEIDGSLIIMGGSAVVSGTVDEDLVLVGGDLEVQDAADVDGECVILGGTVHGEGAERLNCNSFGRAEGLVVPSIVDIPDSPAPPSIELEIPDGQLGSPVGRFVGQLFGVLGQSVLFGLLALLVAAVAPHQLDRVSLTVRQRPAASGAVGLLTAIAGPSLLALLLLMSVLLTLVCIGLLGYPLVLALGLLLAVGVLVGWTAVGIELGRRLAQRIERLAKVSMPVQAALGTALLTLAAGTLSALPFLLGGWLWTLAFFVVGCLGLGAVALTRFGTRPYPPVTEKVRAAMVTLPEEEELN